MNRIYCLLIAALIVGFTADLAPAQIGRGRLLKKMRDDLFGSPEARAKEEAAKRAAEQKRKVEAQQKALREAQRQSQAGRQPTLANQAQPQRTPQQAAQLKRYQEQQRYLQQQQQQQRSQRSPSALQQVQANQSRNRVAPAQPSRNTARKETPQRKGFGFAIKEKGDKLIVTEVARGGNAEEAGLKRGDQIVGIGGVEVENEESFEEIAEILNPGDNIEIAYKRGSRTNDVQIGYGSVPENADEEQAIADVGRVNDDNQFTPRRESSVLGQSEMARQVERLTDTVTEQRRVIETLQNQIRAMQQTTAPGPNTQVPPIRSGNSILQTGPSSNRSKR